MTSKTAYTVVWQSFARVVPCLVVCLAACATVRNENSDPDQADTLGKAVRVLGEQGGSLALMKGLENVRIDPDLVAKTDASNAAARLAKAAKCAVQQGPDYAFLYTDRPPYDLLASVSMEGRLDAAYAEQPTSIGVGAGTKLFTALAILGQGLDRAFVADNSLAETECGEVALKDAPVESVLEAILKSSRIVGFSIESTDEYVFIAGPKPPVVQTPLLNPDALDDAARAFLEKRVDVFLPERSDTPTGVVVTPGAEPLRAAVDTLSRQLGMPVAVAHGLEELPVNPVVMRNVRVSTALDLLVRQWPVPAFGYEVRPDRILIRRRTASDPVPSAAPQS